MDAFSANARCAVPNARCEVNAKRARRRQQLDGSRRLQLIAAREADAAELKAYLANPDLVRRLREDAPLKNWIWGTLCAPGPEGHVDYPALA